jgi:hypothetical protein
MKIVLTVDNPGDPVPVHRAKQGDYPGMVSGGLRRKGDEREDLPGAGSPKRPAPVE